MNRASISRRLDKIAARLPPIGADGDVMIRVEAGMKGLLEGFERARAWREAHPNAPPRPPGAGLASLRAEIARVELMQAERDKNEPAALPASANTPPEEPITPLPRPVLPPRPEPAPPHRPAHPPPGAPAPEPAPLKPAAKKPATAYDWSDL